MSDLLDDDTMDFVQLWDYAQGMRDFEQCFTPEDIVLLDEMVVAQNFALALDIVRHRLAGRHLPEEIAHIARPKKCIKVKPPAPYVPEPTLEEFRAQLQMPPPPDPQEFADLCEPGSTPPTPIDGWESLEARIARENQERRQVRETQDMEYIQAMIADAEKEAMGQEDKSAPPMSPDRPDKQLGANDVIGEVPSEIEKSHADAVLVQVVLPDQRLERFVHGQHTTIGEIANWITMQTGDDYRDSTFCTNFPRAAWSTGDHVLDICQATGEKKRLLLFVE